MTRSVSHAVHGAEPRPGRRTGRAKAPAARGGEEPFGANFRGRWTLAPLLTLLAALLLAGSAGAAPDLPTGFDHHGEKVFNRLNQTPLSALTGLDSTRTLTRYYERRQYPGSPPRIPHAVPDPFGEKQVACLTCHSQGGYAASLGAFAPVTPHPELEQCIQCHVPQRTEQLFAASDWRSLAPPRLGQAQLPGGPPPIPHTLQLRDDCIACHAGPGAVAEIRVEHGARGNCRQCHGLMPATEPAPVFERAPAAGGPTR